jgi:hypothetical protein
MTSPRRRRYRGGNNNRHQRRQRQRHMRAFRRTEQEGQGVWDMRVFFPEDFRAVMAEALADGHAAVLFSLLVQTIKTIGRADPPALCLLCNHTFTGGPPAAFVLVTAHVDLPKQGIGNALCHDCVEPGETLLARLTQSYRQAVLPDLRIVPTPSGVGRA